MPGFANRLQLARDRLAETHPMDAFADLADSAVTKTASPVNSQDFNITIRRSGEDTVILDIRGTLTAWSKEAFVKAFGEAAPKAKRVLMNILGSFESGYSGRRPAGRRDNKSQTAANRRDGLRPFRGASRYSESFRPRQNHDAFGEEDALCCRRFLEKSRLQSIAATNDINVPLHSWATSPDRLTLADVPPSAMNINVEGRRLAGPVQGFGRLWEKRYRLPLGRNGSCAL